MPGIAALEPIPYHEMFVRLCFKYDDTQRDTDEDANVEGGSTDDINDAFLDTLAKYLHFSDVIYEAGTEAKLLEIIAEKGTLQQTGLQLLIVVPLWLVGCSNWDDCCLTMLTG